MCVCVRERERIDGTNLYQMDGMMVQYNNTCLFFISFFRASQHVKMSPTLVDFFHFTLTRISTRFTIHQHKEFNRY